MSKRKAEPDRPVEAPAPQAATSGTWSGRRLGDVEVDVDLRAAWRRDDPDILRDALAFWDRLGILPPDVEPDDRARELAAAAYRDGKLVGVTTAVVTLYPPLRARFAFFRCAVDADERRRLTSTALSVYTRDVIEQWSAEHPEAHIFGLAAIIESADLRQRQRDPVWENTGLNLVGFLGDGRQVRVSWFPHAKYD